MKARHVFSSGVFPSLVALLVMFALVLSGCAAPVAPAATESAAAPAESAAPSSEPVSFSFWGGWTGPDADTMKAIVDKYMAENPNVTIEFETQQWTPLFTKFLAEASVGNAPDIIAQHPFDLGQFAELGVFDETMAPSIGLKAEDYSATAWDGTFYKGVQYAIPLDLHMHGVYYNLDLYEKAGIASPPATGEEMIQTAQLLTLDTNGKNATEEGFDKDNIVQYGLGFAQNHHVAYQMAALLVQQGEIPYSADMTELTFSPEAATKALTYLQDFVWKYHTTPVGEASPADDFVAGNIAMLIDGPWQMPKMESSDLNWATAPYPTVFDKPAAWGAGHSFAFPVTNSSDAQKEAVRAFMRWLAENGGDWAHSGQIPASNAAMEYASTLPNRQAFIDSMPTMYLLPGHPKATLLFSSAQTSPPVIMAQSLLLDQADPAEAAAQYIESMNAILAAP